MKNNLLKSFSFHDGKILIAEKKGKDFLIRFSDGWIENQVNDLIFINCRVLPDYNFLNVNILQLENINFENNEWTFSLEMPSEEKDIYIPSIITIVSEKIIARLYINDELIKEEELKV